MNTAAAVAAARISLLAVIAGLAVNLYGTLTAPADLPDRTCYASITECTDLRTTLDNR